MERQQQLLEARYDLRDAPSDLRMSAGRKAVQQDVRVKLPAGNDVHVAGGSKIRPLTTTTVDC
jgi:hypothetical protein